MNVIETQRGAFSGLVPNRYIKMSDGAIWRQFEIEGGVIVLTSSGQELLKHQNPHTFFESLRQYKDAVEGRNHNGNARQYLANGGNGEVYSIAGHSLVVKESRSSHSLYSALQRMDTLSRVIETHLPHWVSVVPHYGLITARNLDREYLLMQKIDNGISLEDLVQYVNRSSARSDSLTASIGKYFPNLNHADIEVLLDQVRELEDKLKEYVNNSEALEQGHTYKSLMPDPNYANILVEPLNTPIGGKRFKLWIIDQ